MLSLSLRGTLFKPQVLLSCGFWLPKKYPFALVHVDVPMFLKVTLTVTFSSSSNVKGTFCCDTYSEPFPSAVMGAIGITLVNGIEPSSICWV